MRRREIAAYDFEDVVNLLVRGFPERKRAYWTKAVAIAEAQAAAVGRSSHGYVLENDGALVGVILLIWSGEVGCQRTSASCNLSSWYVEPAFRNYAPLLIASALQHKDVTFVNISPAAHTRPVIEAQGFECYSSGQFFAVPGGAIPRRGVRIRPISKNSAVADIADGRLLAEHAVYGCLSLVCETTEGILPFVFLARRVANGRIPGAQLIYCRDLNDFVRLAGPLGMFLVRRGIACLMIDSNGPIRGLIGKYYPGKAPKYFKGPHKPALGNLAYTELPMFGP